MKRTWLVGLMPSLAICSATSICVAEPEPSSLMPGPSGTESRCAPEMIVRSVRPVVVSAITLRVWSTRFASWPTSTPSRAGWSCR